MKHLRVLATFYQNQNPLSSFSLNNFEMECSGMVYFSIFCDRAVMKMVFSGCVLFISFDGSSESSEHERFTGSFLPTYQSLLGS